jgi:uncharacterized protein YggE
MLKRLALVVAALALLLLTAAGAVWVWGQLAPPANAQSDPDNSSYSPAQTITVVGTGTNSVKPDIARASIGVETQGETVSEAVEANAETMEAILDALEEAGIDPEDIQTTNYSVHMERYPEPMPRAISSEPGEDEALPQYRVSNMVTITIRDLEGTSGVLDAAIAAGANNIWGVTFSLEDMSEAQAGARADAIGDAEARASALAELGGVELGPVMSISEVIGGGAVPTTVMAERALAAGAGPISSGELDVSYQVQVIYFVEP